MTPYFGDFAEDATVYIPFNTFSSDDPSASVTITNLADADIYVHKNAGLTQIATDGATIAIDYDGITGNHMITIDTSVHADYAIGSDYQVRIEGTTVDAGTVNAFIGSFSIENRYNAAAEDLANVTDGLGALRTLLLDIPTVSELNARTLVAASYFDPATDTVANVTLVATTTTNTDMRGTDSAATAANLAVVDTVVDGIQTDLSNGTDGLGAIKTDSAAIKVITDALGATGAARLSLSANQIIPFTVDTATNAHTPTTTEFQADDITEATAAHYSGRLVVWTTGVLTGQITRVSSYEAVGGIGQFTVVGMTEAPSNNDTGILI